MFEDDIAVAWVMSGLLASIYFSYLNYYCD